MKERDLRGRWFPFNNGRTQNQGVVAKCYNRTLKDDRNQLSSRKRRDNSKKKKKKLKKGGKKA